MLLRIFLLIFLLIIPISSINILLFLIGTNHFERSTFEYLAQQLALRHHNTITVKPILIPEEPRLVKPKLHLVREKTLKNLLPKKLHDPLEKVGHDVPWRQTYEIDEMDVPYWAGHNHSCEKILNSNLMETLKKDQVDVAIVYSGNPCQLAIVHVLGIPFVYYDLEGFTDETIIASNTPWNLNAMSTQRPPSETKSPYLNRLINGVYMLKEAIVQSGYSKVAKLISRRYRNLDGPITGMFATDYEIKKTFKDFPDVNQIKQQAEMYFINTDPLLEYDYSLPQNVVPVGGLHIDHVKPLFSPWNETIAQAQDGVIVVSLGTQADSSKMTDTQAKAILGALSKLTTYRIYWRIGPNFQLPGVELTEIPTHINLTTFIPQNDLIAHKRTKLLVTNGGMLSVMEALVHGVPIVGLPLYGVNHHNLLKVKNKGLGVLVQKNQLTEKTLYNALKEVLDNPKFENTAKDMAKEFKSRPASPFDTALHYIEHIGRHRSAKFFKPPQRTSFIRLLTLTNYEFWLIATASVAIFVMAMFGFVRMFFGFISWLLCSRRSSNKAQKTNQKGLEGSARGRTESQTSQTDENGNLLRKRK